ncbi:ribosome small subunit-dependent GTPase A [Bacillus taeanensis]|uniref:Small ribosomal subunit biogenesis GTPase RsgA n=1 Tax=Bacillus taeanensis TaxID=273032 RepID=A0A366XU64_9BACI|nr:ribosome small subunit-dependent GTPase A [Bacillus taeanensis]RBW67511.1 ribosome small subunit-dependent GTPase A [Bacillus taeanensis]
MAEGRIIKALSGFYYVADGENTIQCRGRGNFRKRKITPLVGDIVEYEAENMTDGYVLEVYERKNALIRPPIANVDQAILVFSIKEPDLNLQLLDKFLVHIEANDIEPLICFSKYDLADETLKHQVDEIVKQYEQVGYTVLLTSTIEEEGIKKIRPFLTNNISVVAGQSGVGKSSLLNALEPSLHIETNNISMHLGRGKHTTRHVELLQIEGGLVADTPGFSSLDFHNIEAEDLTYCFPEMRALINDCKFRGCTHTQEPKCAVREAVEGEKISSSRYKHYVEFLQEIKSQKRRY